MSSSGPALPGTQPVTRRKTFKPLNQMNGDLLPNLKKPLCSEVSNRVTGQNAGCDVMCRKLVRLSFKERNIALDKVKRSQDAVFQSHLKRHKHQKLLQRRHYEQMQELNRYQQLWTMSRQRQKKEESQADTVAAMEEVLPNTAEGTRPSAEAVHTGNQEVTSTGDKVQDSNRLDEKGKQTFAGGTDVKDQKDVDVTAKNDDVNVDLVAESEIEAPSGVETVASSKEAVFSHRRTKVLQVRKRDSNESLVEEILRQPSQDKDTDWNGRSNQRLDSFSKIDNVFLEKTELENSPQLEIGKMSQEDETRSTTSGYQDPVAPSKRKRRHGTVRPAYFLDPMPGLKRSAGRDDINSMAVINEEDNAKKAQSHKQGPTTLEPHCKQLDRTLSPSFVEQRVLSGWVANTFSSQSSATADHYSEEVDPQTLPQLSMVRRRKLMARRRERVMKDSLDSEEPIVYVKNGQGQIVPAGVSFKRATFQPPSNRESHFRRKMLRAQQEARLAQRQKMENFFDKIFEEPRKQRRREVIREPPKPEEKKAGQVKKAEMGLSLSYMMTAFQTQAPAQDVDPDSSEALKDCRYVRLHSPMTEEGKAMAKRNRRSSWAVA